VTFAALLAEAVLGVAFAGAYPAGEEVIGEVQTHEVRAGESLIELARDYDVGFNEIAAANPGLDPFVPKPGSLAVIPTAWIVPREATTGTLVVNLAEMRLYYAFSADRSGTATLLTMPVGIGSEGTDTPPGVYRVVEKEFHPAWHVPASIRKERPELPEVVPFGPDDPLGTHALRLSSRSILIHGTNRPYGIGRRVSHGCIHLYPEDVLRLYQIVPVGTAVAIVRQPVKAGQDGDRIYLEVHSDAGPPIDALSEARRLLTDRGFWERVDPAKVEAAAQERSGIPVDVTR